MTNIIDWLITNLSDIWDLLASNWILASVLIISILNLIATLVIHTMGNKN